MAGKSNKKKFHLVKWSFVCKPKGEGGLGFRLLIQMNRALLRKWLWRIGERSNSLWRHDKIWSEKKRMGRLGGPTYRFSGLWRGINSVKTLFAAHIRYKIGSSERVLFWLDDWVGDRPLAKEFTILFRCASNQLAKSQRLHGKD